MSTSSATQTNKWTKPNRLSVCVFNRNAFLLSHQSNALVALFSVQTPQKQMFFSTLTKKKKRFDYCKTTKGKPYRYNLVNVTDLKKVNKKIAALLRRVLN